MTGCVEAAVLTCPSSNTYMVLVNPGCAALVAAVLKARGRVVYERGGVLGVSLGDASVTFIAPSRLIVKLPLGRGIDSFLEELFAAGPGYPREAGAEAGKKASTSP